MQLRYKPARLDPPLGAAADVDVSHAFAAVPVGVRFGEFTFTSHFQPIYSLPHRRLVGHEALLRARDGQGRRVTPPAVFAACTTEASLSDCDRLSRLVHLQNYAASARRSEWLFLNVHPAAFQRLAQQDGSAQLTDMQHHFGLAAGSIVLEILEAETADPLRLAESIALARGAGMLIAIDDFGAGHSNFDRVWRMRPDIVKLDRSLVARAAEDYSAQRILAQMVSLLHECGTMVLLEGIETREEALVALDCDAEMVQGYYFGRPGPALVPAGAVPAGLVSLHSELVARRSDARSRQRDRVQRFLDGIALVARRLSEPPADPLGLPVAATGFLALPGAEACYLLDGQGHQVGTKLWAEGRAPGSEHAVQPLLDADGACWAQRPYFRRALESPGEPQVTRPYRTLNGQHLCATVSIACSTLVNGHAQRRVVCGDFRWEE